LPDRVAGQANEVAAYTREATALRSDGWRAVCRTDATDPVGHILYLLYSHDD